MGSAFLPGSRGGAMVVTVTSDHAVKRAGELLCKPIKPDRDLWRADPPSFDSNDLRHGAANAPHHSALTALPPTHFLPTTRAPGIAGELLPSAQPNHSMHHGQFLTSNNMLFNDTMPSNHVQGFTVKDNPLISQGSNFTGAY